MHTNHQRFFNISSTAGACCFFRHAGSLLSFIGYRHEHQEASETPDAGRRLLGPPGGPAGMGRGRRQEHDQGSNHRGAGRHADRAGPEQRQADGPPDVDHRIQDEKRLGRGQV